jgi:hypothetical protein
MPAFYVLGDHEKLLHLQEAAHKQTTELRTRFTERIDLWLNATRPVLEVSVQCSTNAKSEIPDDVHFGWQFRVYAIGRKVKTEIPASPSKRRIIVNGQINYRCEKKTSEIGLRGKEHQKISDP